jgi:hypothetical protein
MIDVEADPDYSWLPYLAMCDEPYTDQFKRDIYMLGVLLYEMLVGLPFTYDGLSLSQAIERKRDPLSPVEKLRHDLPPYVAAFVNQAVAHDPLDRFGSWRELTAGLAAVRSTFDPMGQEELAAWLQSLPTELRPAAEPPLDSSALGDWRQLPHSGYVPVPRPERSAVVNDGARARALVDPDLVYTSRDQRPMYAHGNLLVDARPVSAAAYERFAIATATPSSGAAGEEPRTSVTHEQADAYARWAGKRLPTDEEWTVVVGALGPEKLGVGEIWEWTSTPQRGGYVARGGRWRDAWDRPPVPENRSHETAMAVDVGFRCVMDRG